MRSSLDVFSPLTANVWSVLATRQRCISSICGMSTRPSPCLTADYVNNPND